MLSEYDKRAAILVALHAGRGASEISDFLKLPSSLVYRVKASYDQGLAAGDLSTSTPHRKQHSRRSDSLRTPEFVAKLQNLVDEDPGRSMRSLAAELGVSEGTIRNTVHEDLRYKSYGMRKGQFMSEATKETRYKKAKALLNSLKHPSSSRQLIFFSDEKVFNQDQKINSRNNRWLCQEISEVPIVMQTKFPASVMVLGVVSNEGDVMPPHFFDKGARINAALYINTLETVVKPWMDGVARGRPYVFQQDGAPAHTASSTQQWLAANVPEFWPKEIWPPSSPDCNPLDYFVWGVCERETNKQPHNTLDSLKAKINQVMGDLDRDILAKACSRFRPRIEAVVEAGGDFIE